MSEKIINDALENAVANVECETGEIPLETKEVMRQILNGETSGRDFSLLYELAKKELELKENGRGRK